jgi:hypothetical protein
VLQKYLELFISVTLFVMRFGGQSQRPRCFWRALNVYILFSSDFELAGVFS